MVSESEDPLMKKIVGIDIGGSSVKLAYFAGSTLKKAAMAPLPDNMVADGRILGPWTPWRTSSARPPGTTAFP